MNSKDTNQEGQGTMKTKHTQEPWNLHMIESSYGEIKHGIITATRNATDYCQANPRIAIVDHIERGEGEANASRIVSCVNACAGINPDAVKDVVDALRDMVAVCKGKTLPYENHPAMIQAMNALAKMEE